MPKILLPAGSRREGKSGREGARGAGEERAQGGVPARAPGPGGAAQQGARQRYKSVLAFGDQ